LNLLKKYINLFILRTFSKAFCLAGIRLGYLIAGKEYLDLIRRIRNTKEINAISQIAAITALENWDFYENYIKEVQTAKIFFEEELKKMNFEVFGKFGNFVMIKVQNITEFINYLETHYIYIRDRSYVPQLENFVRITVGTKDQMQKVLTVISSFLKS